MSTDASGDNYAALARALSAEVGVVATLETATANAVLLLDGCDYAGITLIERRRQVTSVAPSDPLVARADELQQETGEGPCLQSIVEHETVYAADLRDDPRWPQWTPRAADELGFRCVLAIQLFVGPSTMGALNLFSTKPQAFDVDDRVSAHAFAAHVAVAATAAQDQANLESALANRTVIGQAEGMLMQALKISPAQAFAMLTRVSQARNVKLHLVAADIVSRGLRAELFESQS